MKSISHAKLQKNWMMDNNNSLSFLSLLHQSWTETQNLNMQTNGWTSKMGTDKDILFLLMHYSFSTASVTSCLPPSLIHTWIVFIETLRKIYRASPVERFNAVCFHVWPVRSSWWEYGFHYRGHYDRVWSPPVVPQNHVYGKSSTVTGGTNGLN